MSCLYQLQQLEQNHNINVTNLLNMSKVHIDGRDKQALRDQNCIDEKSERNPGNANLFRTFCMGVKRGLWH
jgi:hypothetical protein